MHQRPLLPARENYLSSRLEVRYSAGPKGRGLFATARIARAELLVVWGGVEYDGVEFDGLGEDARIHSLQVDDDRYLVPLAEHPVDWVNHSCEPSAGLADASSLVAIRNIEPGEEIAYDYAMSDSSSYDEFACVCGSSRCRSVITGSDWMRPELWERYQGHFSPYLQRRIDRLRSPVDASR